MMSRRPETQVDLAVDVEIEEKGYRQVERVGQTSVVGMHLHPDSPEVSMRWSPRDSGAGQGM